MTPFNPRVKLLAGELRAAQFKWGRGLLRRTFRPTVIREVKLLREARGFEGSRGRLKFGRPAWKPRDVLAVTHQGVDLDTGWEGLSKEAGVSNSRDTMFW